MFFRCILHAVLACLVAFAPHAVLAASSSTSSHSSLHISSPVAPSRTSSLTSTSQVASSISSVASASASTPPDVLLNVPNLSVGRIELDVDNLQADINLNANVASLVSLNAGVAISVQKINVTIVDIEAQLELIIRLGHLVDIVNRVFQSLDLNPLLINTLNNVTSILEPIVGEVDGLLGSITQGGTALSFLVDNLGNIVQQVVGGSGNTVSTIVGNYLTNMTDTGVVQSLGSGLTEKTYSYSPLNALVDIVFNTAGQVVQATVVKQTTATSTAVSSIGTAQPTNTSTTLP